MDFLEKLRQISANVEKVKQLATSEEATKQALVLPFVRALGYDDTNLEEVKPEYTADFGVKKGEKVDYALCRDDAPLALVECKHWNDNLNKATGQLHRYFSVTDVQIGVLTNGIEYRFFSDFDKVNLLDAAPFFVYRIDEPEKGVEILEDLRKDVYEPKKFRDRIVARRNRDVVKTFLKRELKEPSDDFVRAVAQLATGVRIAPDAIPFYAAIVRGAVDEFTREISGRDDKNVSPQAGNGDDLPPKSAELKLQDWVGFRKRGGTLLGTKPLHFIGPNFEIGQKGDQWSDLYVAFFRELYRQFPEKICEKINAPLLRHGKRNFLMDEAEAKRVKESDSAHMYSLKELCDNLFVDTAMDSNCKMRHFIAALKLCYPGGEWREATVVYRPAAPKNR